jgi:hypothetical protein
MNIVQLPAINDTIMEPSRTFGAEAIVETRNLGFWNLMWRYFFNE